MEPKIKYFATRIGTSIIFRRTTKHVEKVKSKLYNATTGLYLAQISFRGGIAIGSMQYAQWLSHGGPPIADRNFIQIKRSSFIEMLPFMQH